MEPSLPAMDAEQSGSGGLRQAGSLLPDNAVVLKSLKVEIPDEQEQDEEEKTLATIKEEKMIIEQKLHIKPCSSTNIESKADTPCRESLVTNFKILKHIKTEPPEETPNIGNETSDDAVLLKSVKVEKPDEQNEEEKILAAVKKEEMFIGQNLHVKSCFATISGTKVTNIKIKSEPSEETPDLEDEASDDAVLLKMPKLEILDEDYEDEDEETLAMLKDKIILQVDFNATSWTKSGTSQVTPNLGNVSGADTSVSRTPTMPRGVSFDPNNTFICDDCGKQFNEKPLLIQHVQCHMRSYFTQPYTCSICGYKFPDNSHLQSHLRRHTGEKPFTCLICPYESSQKNTLTRHMRSHLGHKPYSCSICGHKFVQKSSVTVHMRSHTGERPYPCSICGKKFARNCYMKSHMLIHPESELKKHMGVPIEQKSYSCNICKYQSTRKSNLEKHKLIHSEEKPITCNLCPYQCSRNSLLNTHMRRHRGEKPFSCSTCGNKFTDSSHLTRHMRIHTGEKPYSCNKCSYRSSRNSNLKKHMLVHTEKKRFSCSMCPYNCTQRGRVLKHEMSHANAQLKANKA